MDKVILSGFVVALLGLVLTAVFGLLGIEVPLDVLTDNVLTLGEALEIVGLALLALSKKVRLTVKEWFSKPSDNS